VILRRGRAAGAWILACGIVLSLAHGRADAASKAPAKETKEKTTQVSVRAGKTDNPNFPLARQFSEAIALATNGSFALDVKESQGTVQCHRCTEESSEYDFHRLAQCRHARAPRRAAVQA
jgi:hypothetical protein